MADIIGLANPDNTNWLDALLPALGQMGLGAIAGNQVDTSTAKLGNSYNTAAMYNAANQMKNLAGLTGNIVPNYTDLLNQAKGIYGRATTGPPALTQQQNMAEAIGSGLLGTGAYQTPYTNATFQTQNALNQAQKLGNFDFSGYYDPANSSVQNALNKANQMYGQNTYRQSGSNISNAINRARQMYGTNAYGQSGNSIINAMNQAQQVYNANPYATSNASVANTMKQAQQMYNQNPYATSNASVANALSQAQQMYKKTPDYYAQQNKWLPYFDQQRNELSGLEGGMDELARRKVAETFGKDLGAYGTTNAEVMSALVAPKLVLEKERAGILGTVGNLAGQIWPQAATQATADQYKSIAAQMQGAQQQAQNAQMGTADKYKSLATLLQGAQQQTQNAQYGSADQLKALATLLQGAQQQQTGEQLGVSDQYKALATLLQGAQQQQTGEQLGATDKYKAITSLLQGGGLQQQGAQQQVDDQLRAAIASMGTQLQGAQLLPTMSDQAALTSIYPLLERNYNLNNQNWVTQQGALNTAQGTQQNALRDMLTGGSQLLNTGGTKGTGVGTGTSTNALGTALQGLLASGSAGPLLQSILGSGGLGGILSKALGIGSGTTGTTGTTGGLESLSPEDRAIVEEVMKQINPDDWGMAGEGSTDLGGGGYDFTDFGDLRGGGYDFTDWGNIDPFGGGGYDFTDYTDWGNVDNYGWF